MEAEMSVGDVMALGGKEEEMEWLRGIDEDTEEMETGEEDGKELRLDEVKNFVEKLGLDKKGEKGKTKKIKKDGKTVIKKEGEKKTQKEDSRMKISMDKKSPESRLEKTPNSKRKKTALDRSNETIRSNALGEQTPASKNKNDKKAKKKNTTPKKDGTSESPNTFSVSTVARWISSHKVRRHPMIQPGGRWFDQTPEDPLVSADDDLPSRDCFEKIQEFASTLLKGESASYQQRKNSFMKGDMAFIGKVINTGVLKDKTAAQTLLIQESPVHTLDNLDALVGIVKKKGRREALMAMSTLKDLFVADLIPPDRKLVQMERRPLTKLDRIVSGNVDAREKRLVLWKFEDELKRRFLDYVKAIDVLLKDTLEESRKQALSVNFDLLCNTPEQETTLLEMLVNKLGDPSYKVASKVVHLLNKLIQEHPDMDSIVVKRVEVLLFRPNVKQKAQYYSLCFLNGLVLSKRKSALAQSLISIYFCCFNRYVKAGEVNSKMLTALLLGVNRAFPFCENLDAEIETHLQTIFRVVHTAHFNVSVQALMLLFQIVGTREEIQDRFYRALYVKLFDAELERSAYQAMFLNLVYKSLMRDEAEKRVKAFVKRLLQIANQHSPPFICGCLLVLGRVLKKHGSILSAAKFRSAKDAMAAEESESDEEHFVDIEDETDGTALPKKSSNAEKASWLHRKNYADSKIGSVGKSYDPINRNPLYCGAEHALVFELNRLAHHFHPSVSLFAREILTENDLEYKGDPLTDFSLSRFLERFVYKNPKTIATLDKNRWAAVQSRRKREEPEGVKRLAVNSEEYLRLADEEIPVDERFFRQFFSQKQSLAEMKKKVKDEELDDVDDDEFDEFLSEHHKNIDEHEADFASEAVRVGAAKAGAKKRKRGDDDDEEDDGDDDEVMDDEDFDDDDDDDDLEFNDDELKEMDEAVESTMDAELDAVLKGERVESEAGSEDGSDNDDDLNEEQISFSDSGDELETKDDDNEIETSKPKKKSKTLKSYSWDDDDGDDDDDNYPFGKSSSSVGKKFHKSKSKDDLADLFADAEEFSYLLDENVDDTRKGGKGGKAFDMLGAGALSNKDKASVKQLQWEVKRDQWVRGEDWRGRKKGAQSGKMVKKRREVKRIKKGD